MEALSGNLMLLSNLSLKFFRLLDFAPELFILNWSINMIECVNIGGGFKVEAVSRASYKIRWLDALLANGAFGSILDMDTFIFSTLRTRCLLTRSFKLLHSF